MAARVAVTRQRTLDLTVTPPKPPKRKPSARAAFRLDEIPVVAEQMTGTYALRDRLLFRCNTVWGPARPRAIVDDNRGHLPPGRRH